MSSSESVIIEETPDNLMTAIGRNWWVLLFPGVLSLAVGVVALVWPGKTVIVVAIVFAIWLIVSGIFSLVRGFAHGLTGGMRALFIITGILSLVLGIFAIRGEFQELYILSLFIGIGFLFRGFSSLFL
ncbi:MAG: HdeD family acid-resistance protein, partial [Candidatus Nanopelagicales bacterium]